MTDDGFPEGTSSSQNEDRSRQTKSVDEQFCSSCGEVIKKEAEICPECGIRQKGSNSGEKNPGIAAVLSFIITGAGQIYNGEIGKGIGLMVLQVVNVLLMAVLIGFITFPATWIWAIYDAYKTAEKINTGE